MDLELSGKVAIVTGGSRGIGAAAARSLAQEGAAVVVNYLGHAEAAAQVVSAIRQNGGRAVSFKADVAKLDEVEAMVKAALAEFGQVDILVNNAGMSTHTRTIEETTAADIEKVMSVNCVGVVNCVKAAAPHMKSRRYGKIINIVSYRAYAPQLPSPYGISKGAALIFSIEAAIELAPFNINVVSISPGNVVTDMMREKGLEGDKLKAFEAQIPIGRAARPEDIANLVCFLASDCARHITGTDILITGGEMFRW